MKTIKQIIENELCTGCGLCASVFNDKISLNMNESGFFRPIITDELNNIETKLFNEFCPGCGLERLNTFDENYNIIWGNIINIRMGFSSDKNLRFKGASGGAISGFLYFLLNENIVDYVINIKGSSKYPLMNIISVTKNYNDILETTGSRYSPSAPLRDIDTYLKNDGAYAFVGKPCDVYALKKYINTKIEYQKKIKVFISFACAGIPSLNATKFMLDKFDIRESEVKFIRYRGNGWPGKTVIETKSGKIYEMKYIESWGEILGQAIQFRCKICPDGLGESADVVFGDAWITENGYPTFDESDGLSLIISRSQNGENLIKRSINTKYIKLGKKIHINELDNIQPYHKKRRSSICARILAMKLLFKLVPRYRRLRILRAAFKQSFIVNFRNFIGMCIRIIFKKV